MLEKLGRKATSEAAFETLLKEFAGAVERSDVKLTTSKERRLHRAISRAWQGEEHDYEEVGGRTFLIYKDWQ